MEAVAWIFYVIAITHTALKKQKKQTVSVSTEQSAVPKYLKSAALNRKRQSNSKSFRLRGQSRKI